MSNEPVASLTAEVAELRAEVAALRKRVEQATTVSAILRNAGLPPPPAAPTHRPTHLHAVSDHR